MLSKNNLITNDRRQICFAGCGAILSQSSGYSQRGHVKSRYSGGSDDLQNLRLVCGTCNLQMGTMNMFEWMKKYNRTPPIEDDDFNEFECEPLEFIEFHQRELRYNVSKIFEKLPVKGIINACTGSGKTAMCIEGIGRHIRGKICLWITEYKRILESQFTPYNIASWKAAKFVPKETAFLSKHALKECEQFPDTCIIFTTIDTARVHYKKIINDPRFLGFIIDESHHSDGARTSGMLEDMKNCDIVLGLSATHLDTSRTRNIFGEQPYLVDYSLLEGWQDGIIREVKIMCCMLKKTIPTNKEGVKNSLYDRIENPDILITNIEKILDQTTSRKGLLWCERQDDADKWYELLKNHFDSEDMGIYIDHTGLSDKNNDIHQYSFMNAESNAIMITAQKYGEGVDIKNLDFAGVITENPDASERIYLQRVGRLLRKEGREGSGIFCNFSVTIDLETYTERMRDLFINYYNGVKRKLTEVKYSGSSKEKTKITKNQVVVENSSVSIIFEFLDEVHVTEIFERDAEFAADLLCNTGKGVSFVEIKNTLRILGIKDPPSAQVFFNNCKEAYPKIGRWWDIAKFLPMDYTKLLDLDNSGYYQTLQEAKVALSQAEKKLTLQQINLLHWTDRYNEMRKIDPKLPVDWQGLYKLTDTKQYWDPDIEKILDDLFT
jgi:superfamily II DNA or RNA helicase